jgi:hypothetical protein
MDLSRLAKDEKGQAQAVQVQIELIVTLLVAIIVVYQLFISGVGPTDNASSADYDASARSAWENVQTISWAGIGLMAVAVIILAAAVILQIIRGGFGGGRGV